MWRHSALRWSLLLSFAISSLGAGPVPTNKPVAYPDWWFEQDVIPRLPASAAKTTPSWPIDYPTADDYAMANIGQLKYFASKAREEFVERLGEAGPGPAVESLIEAWSAPPSIGVTRDDYAALNQGQLKAVAQPFYARLNEFVYVGPPLAAGSQLPWTGATSDDDAYAAVNLGQLKFLFSFDPRLVPIDSDGDGMDNIWEVTHGLDPRQSSDALLDSDGDGLANLQEFGLQTDPSKTDTDDDGLPDAWEAAHGLDPRASTEASTDFDGDGRSTAQEFLENTNPQVIDTSPPPSGAAPGAPGLPVVTKLPSGALRLTWSGAATMLGYLVERSTDYLTWQIIGFTAGATTTHDDTQVLPGVAYAYRVKGVY